MKKIKIIAAVGLALALSACQTTGGSSGAGSAQLASVPESVYSGKYSAKPATFESQALASAFFDCVDGHVTEDASALSNHQKLSSSIENAMEQCGDTWQPYLQDFAQRYYANNRRWRPSASRKMEFEGVLQSMIQKDLRMKFADHYKSVNSK